MNSFCLVCGGRHKYPGETCSNCSLCYKYCYRTEQCKFTNADREVDEVVVKDQPVVKDEASCPLHRDKFRNTFKVLLASHKGIKFPDGCTIESLASEFERLYNEKLVHVDKSHKYLTVLEGDKVKFLDSESLFTNQDLEYIQMNGDIRINYGKNVAVMGG